MKRRGTSLVEVLVAMFIMTIGMLSLLALFPLGVMKMAQALRDERAGQALQQAENFASALNLRFEPALTSPQDYFQNPGAGADAVAGNPSYAVFVDPFGVTKLSGAQHLGGLFGQSTIRRVSPNFMPSNASQFNRIHASFFAIKDDLFFDNAQVTLQTSGSGTTPMRDSTFTWAYLMQRPNQSETGIVECTTVLFYKRPGLQPNLQLAESYFDNCTPDFNNNTFFIPQSATMPALKKGDWLLDCTVETRNGGPVPHAKFYRAVRVEESTSAAAGLLVEVDPPIRGFQTGATNASIMIIESVYDVLENGLGHP